MAPSRTHGAQWVYRAMRRALLISGVVALLSTLVTIRAIHALGDFAGESESFPGWLGSTIATKVPEAPSSGFDRSKVKQLSAWHPRAYLYEGFLSDEECDHIINFAEPRLERSSVTNNDDGSSELSDIRTSSGTFIDKGKDAVMKRIEARISEWTFLPIQNQESLQVLRYTKGQKYEPHVDYFHDPVNTQRGGHRYATVLMYLNNVTLGGETVFPTAKDPTPKDDTWSDCAKGYLAVKPKKGDALLFFSMHPDGSPDDTSLHYACPVVEGVKWSAPMWVHVSDFNKVYKYDSATEAKVEEMGDPAGCHDTNAVCGAWAASGECERNHEYMSQACKKACSLC